jgi:hypothetical protein
LFRQKTYLQLSRATLKKENAQLCPIGEYRYINHSDKVATLGFSSVEELFEYTYIRFDKVTVPLMQNRYKQLFQKEKT